MRVCGSEAGSRYQRLQRLHAGETIAGSSDPGGTEVRVPVIVLGELRAGFARGRYRAENEADLRRFLNINRVSVINVDEQTTRLYAQTYDSLRRQGTPIPQNDIWIAALVLQYGLTLCTSDAHFQHVPHLPIC